MINTAVHSDEPVPVVSEKFSCEEALLESDSAPVQPQTQSATSLVSNPYNLFASEGIIFDTEFEDEISVNQGRQSSFDEEFLALNL